MTLFDLIWIAIMLGFIWVAYKVGEDSDDADRDDEKADRFNEVVNEIKHNDYNK